jgi:hypothetical protein
MSKNCYHVYPFKSKYIKEINLDVCFWSIEHEHYKCECDKVYFDLNIDFNWCKVIICKDWYVMKLKNFMMNSAWATPKYIIEDAKENFIKYLYEEYFKTPIFDEICDNNNGRIFGISNPYIEICNRPYIARKVSVMRLLKFAYGSNNIEYKFNEVGRYIQHNIKPLLLVHIKENYASAKYDKLRRLLNNMCDMFFNDLAPAEFMSELLIEQSKLTTQKKLR